MPRQLRVFLCHAHSDKDTVKALYARLKREGVDVWLDKEKLLPGADWEYEIRKAVRESDVVIVCLSKQFNQAGFRQKEVRIALEEADKKPEGEIFIIPARLEECDNLESLGRWHWVDLFENDGFQRLIFALRIRADKIGATLRQRGATISRQKTNTEQPDAKKERIESARREEEEQGRQRLSKEQAGREAAEKAERETAEKLKREQAERKKAEREKVEREKKEHELAQKLAREEGNFVSREDLKLFSISAILILIVILVGSVLNSLFSKLPEAISTPTLQFFTETPTSPIPIPPTFTPTPGMGSTMVSEKDGMVLVFVPEGEFTMGSNVNSDEQPIHQVYLESFWIDQTEVTNIMYTKCVVEGDCAPPSSTRSFGREVYFGNSKFDDFPVIYVNWYKANAYCKWAGRQLPTEAQWEKAARSTDGRTYPWGEGIDCTKANYNSFSCFGDTAEVGGYPDGASIYGALNMAGNVWEWVNSLYQPYPYDENDGREDLTASGSRVLRGGAWYYDVGNVRSANRYGDDPSNADNVVGFRCALSQS